MVREKKELVGKKNNDQRDDLIKRLDALIRVLLENLYTDKNKKFGRKEAIEILNSVGLAPIEIAKILGKKSGTDITPYIYSNKKMTSGKSKDGKEEKG